MILEDVWNFKLDVTEIAGANHVANNSLRPTEWSCCSVFERAKLSEEKRDGSWDDFASA
jgi:hypothetical protein